MIKSTIPLRRAGSFYLEEVFNPLRVVAVALSTDSLHFFDLTRFTGSLDVLEVNVRLLAEIHNRPKEVKQALDGDGREETAQRSAQSTMTQSLHRKLKICYLTHSLALIQHARNLHSNPDSRVTPTLITLEGLKELH